MSHAGIIAVLVCIAIFVGTLEQARIVLKRKTWPPKGSPVEAKRNTLRGDLAALMLGIKQVQGYIDTLLDDHSPDVVEACDEAQKGVDRARALHKEVADNLDQANTENAVKVVELKLDMARLHIRQARALVEVMAEKSKNGHFDDDGDDDDDINGIGGPKSGADALVFDIPDADHHLDKDPDASRLSGEIQTQIKQIFALTAHIAELDQDFRMACAFIEKRGEAQNLPATAEEKREIMIVTEQLRIVRSYTNEVMRHVFSWRSDTANTYRPTFEQASWAYTAANLTLGFAGARVIALRGEG